MDNKTPKTGRFRRMLFRLLGPSISKAIVARTLRKKIDKGPAILPVNSQRCSEILFILPADRTEMIFQLENIFSILGRYRNSNLTFICPVANTSFVSALKNARVMKFEPAEFLIYSTEFNRLVGGLAAKAFDICVMLERKYTLAHLYLVGMSRAHLRVGWENGLCTSPFLNIRLIAVPREGVNLWERNLEAAKILDAETSTRMRWGVPKSATEEVAMLLNEHRLKKTPALICVDLASLQNNCGDEWCAKLLSALKSSGAGQYYIFSAEEVSSGGSHDTPFPVLPPMSIPKAAALMAYTDIVITGVGALLGLAQISSSKLIPVVTQEQAVLYCRQADGIQPVIVSDKPADADIKTVQKSIRALMSAPQKHLPAAPVADKFPAA